MTVKPLTGRPESRSMRLKVARRSHSPPSIQRCVRAAGKCSGKVDKVANRQIVP